MIRDGFESAELMHRTSRPTGGGAINGPNYRSWNNNQRIAKGYPHGDDDDTVRIKGTRCPISIGVDQLGNVASGWKATDNAYASQFDRDQPEWADYNLARRKKGDDGKKLMLQDGRRCVRYTPDQAEGIGWNQILKELTQTAKDLRQQRHEHQGEYQGALNDSNRLWKLETRKKIEESRKQKLENTWGAEAMFEPSHVVGCDPIGTDSDLQEKWVARLGTPLDPSRPGMKPTDYELTHDRWYRPAIAQIDGHARCMPDGRPDLEDTYKMTYHGLNNLPLPELRETASDHEMPAMKFYQKALFCAQKDKTDCEKTSPTDAPLGGKLTASDECHVAGETGHEVCVPNEVYNEHENEDGSEGELNADPYGKGPLGNWYRNMREKERKLIGENDQFAKLMMQNNHKYYPDDPGRNSRPTAARYIRPDSWDYKKRGGAQEEYYAQGGGENESEISFMSTTR